MYAMAFVHGSQSLCVCMYVCMHICIMYAMAYVHRFQSLYEGSGTYKHVHMSITAPYAHTCKQVECVEGTVHSEQLSLCTCMAPPGYGPARIEVTAGYEAQMKTHFWYDGYVYAIPKVLGVSMEPRTARTVGGTYVTLIGERFGGRAGMGVRDGTLYAEKQVEIKVCESFVVFCDLGACVYVRVFVTWVHVCMCVFLLLGCTCVCACYEVCDA
jgi:hypothetical protein